MKWQVVCQNQSGQELETGEESDSLGQARQVARDLAWEMRNTTFFVRGPKNRVPCVFHFVKTN